MGPGTPWQRREICSLEACQSKCLAADHQLRTIQKGSSHLLVHGFRTEAGALGQNIVFQGIGRRLHVHGFVQIGGHRIYGFVYRLDIFISRCHGTKMLPDGYNLIEGLLLFHHRLADGIPEKGFDFLAGANDGNGRGVAQGGYLGDGTLLKDKRFYNHGIGFCTKGKIKNNLCFPQ